VAIVSVAAVGALAAVGRRGLEPVTFTPEEREIILGMSPLPPVPPDPTNAVADDPAAAHLGRFLFFDTRLSADGAHSCATCHVPTEGFGDGRPVAEGLGTGTRNSQTIWNVAYHDWFFWDGRADSLWSQATRPIERDVELGSSRLELAHLIAGDAARREAYEGVFGPLPDLSDRTRFPEAGRPDPARPSSEAHRAWSSMAWGDQQAVNEILANVGKAIAAYERRIVSGESPFDRFVEGMRDGDPEKLGAIGEEAKAGLRIFIGEGNCRLCHTGPTFSDGLFHAGLVPPRDGGAPMDSGRYGAVPALLEDMFNAAGPFNDDPGRARAGRLRGLHQAAHDWGAFKTPSLRNVALTGPYMHQGQLEELEDVVRFYSTLEGALQRDAGTEVVLRPLGLDDDEVRALVAFLESLTSTELDPDLLEAPSSPMLEAP